MIPRLCGVLHPESHADGWSCERPPDHDPPHASVIWEEWEEEDNQ
jgi:hypothetical protein